MAAELEQRAAARLSVSLLRFDHPPWWAALSLSASSKLIVNFTGSQTLGEEYCDILQYDVKTRKPPSPRVRLVA